MSSPNGLQVLQTAIVLFAAPLYAGLLSRAAAIVQSKRGPSIWQPYRDLRKLLQKGSAISEHASWVFRGAPFVAFACYLTVSAIVPIITDEPLPLAFLADLIGGRVRARPGQLRDLAGRTRHGQPSGRARLRAAQRGWAAWPSRR